MAHGSPQIFQNFLLVAAQAESIYSKVVYSFLIHLSFYILRALPQPVLDSFCQSFGTFVLYLCHPLHNIILYLLLLGIPVVTGLSFLGFIGRG